MATGAEHNRLHFNDQASSYNKRHEDGIRMLTEEIRERRDWISPDLVEIESQKSGSKPLRVLDYACGTGLVSHALAPFLTEIVGIDLSENMVKEYNTRAVSQGIPPSRMFAHHGNLMKAEEPSEFNGPEFFDFDIAFVGLGFHHFDNPALASKRLVRRLKSSGRIVIIDNLAPDHTGFSEESVQKMFADAGAGQDYNFSVISRPLKIGKGPQAWEQQVFIAKGTKP